LIQNEIIKLIVNATNATTQFVMKFLYSNETRTNVSVIAAKTTAGKPLPYFALVLVDDFGNPRGYEPETPLKLRVSFMKYGTSRRLLETDEDELCDGGGDATYSPTPLLIGDFLSMQFVVEGFIPCSAASGIVSYNVGQLSPNGNFLNQIPNVFQIELSVVNGNLELFRLSLSSRQIEFTNTWIKTNIEIALFDLGWNLVDGVVELNLELNRTNQVASKLGNSEFHIENVTRMSLPKQLLVWIQFHPSESEATVVVDGFTVPNLRRIGSQLEFTINALCNPGFQLNLNTSQYVDALAGNCTRCLPGWITETFDELMCNRCPVGFISNEQNTKCIKCQGNTVSAAPASYRCIPCLNGYVASPNSTSCLKLTFQNPPPTYLVSRHEILIPEITIEVDDPLNPNVQWISLIENINIELALVCNPSLLCTNIQNIPFKILSNMNAGYVLSQFFTIPSDMQQEIGENLFWVISVSTATGILDLPNIVSIQEQYPVYLVGESPVILKVAPISVSVFGDELLTIGGMFFIVDERRITTIKSRHMCSFNSTTRNFRKAALDFYNKSNYAFDKLQANFSNSTQNAPSFVFQTAESNMMSHMDFESEAITTPPPLELVCLGPNHGYTFEKWNVYVWLSDNRNSIQTIYSAELVLYCPKRFWVTESELQHHCMECPQPRSASTQRNSMRIEDCICDVRHYGTFGMGCIECPQVDGFDCSTIGEAHPTIFPGYYIIYDEMPKCQPGGDECSAITLCPYEHACPGRSEKDCFGGPDENECYTGKACQLCCKKYYRDQQDCFKCPPPDNILTAFIAAGGVIAALAILIFIANTPSLGAVVKRVSILLVFLQGLISFQALKISWPPFVYTLFESLRSVSFSLDVVRPECALDLSLLDKNLIMIVLPIFLALCLVLVAVLHGIRSSMKIRDMIQNLDSVKVVSLKHTQLSDILELLKTTVLFLDISKRVGSASPLWLILNPQLRNRVKLREIRTGKQNWAILKRKWNSRRILAQFLGARSEVIQKPEEFDEIRFVVQQAHIDVEYEKMANSIRRLMSAVFAVFIVTFTGVLGVAFSVFNCVKYGDKMVLVLNPEMVCDLADKTYFQLYIVSGISIIAYGLVYPFSQYVLMSSRWCRNMFYQERSGWEMCFGFLVNQYNPENYQWEVVQLIRKAVPLVASVLFTSAIEQTVVGLIIALAYFGSLLAKQPYSNRSLNTLETAQSTVSLLFVFSALLYVIEDEEGQKLLDSTGIYWLSLFNILSVFGVIIWNIASGMTEFRFYSRMHKDKNVSLWLQALHAEAGDILNPESSGTIFEALFVASQSISREHIVAAKERTTLQHASLTSEAQNKMLQIQTNYPWIPQFVLRFIAARKKRAIQNQIDEFIMKQQLNPEILQRFRESPEVSFLLAMRKIEGRVKELWKEDENQGLDLKKNQVAADGMRKTWERIGPNDPPYEYAREVADVAHYLKTTFSSTTLQFLLVYMVSAPLSIAVMYTTCLLHLSVKEIIKYEQILKLIFTDVSGSAFGMRS
jgi:hypothetical protein